MLLRTLRCATALTAAFALVPCSAGDGEPDPGFGTSGVSLIEVDGKDTLALVPWAVIALPDGKLLFGGGRFTPIEGHPAELPQIRSMLARLNADGSVDTSFGNTPIPGVVELPDLVPGTRIQNFDAIVRTEDGSIIAAGTGVDGAPTQGFVLKLDAEGSLDASFGDQGVTLLPNTELHALAIDSQGRVVLCGEQLQGPPVSLRSTVVRLTADGRLDATFGDAGIVSIAWSDASRDGNLNDIKVTADDAVIVAGKFAAYGPGIGRDFAIARLDATGTLDPGFATQGWRVFHPPGTSQTNGIDRLALLPDGSIAFAGYMAAVDTFTGVVLGRLLANGETDPIFGDPATPGYLGSDTPANARGLATTALVAQSDGKLLASVSWFAAAGKQNFLALRTTAAGRLDADFASGGLFDIDLAPEGAFSDVRTMTLQADGRIILAGRVKRSSTSPAVDLAAMRLLNDSVSTDRIFANGFE